MSEWINIKDEPPKEVQGNKILGYNGNYMFECEYDDECWCNVGGETMTYWMPLPGPPKTDKGE